MQKKETHIFYHLLPLACIALQFSLKAYASQEKLVYDIPEQPLNESLLAIGRKHGLQLLFQSKHVKNIIAAPVSGKFSASGALKELLKGLNFEGSIVDNAVITIKPLVRLSHNATPEPIEKKKSAKTAIILEVVTVTGSYIKRSEYDATHPSVVLDQDSAFNTVSTNIGELVERSIAACPGDASFSNQTNRNLGAIFPNLFCVGSDRNLSLVNGRRMVPTASIDFSSTNPGSQFDLNALPAIMLNKVDIIQTGGGPIYGSGALSGVLNLNLKDEIEGFEAITEYGISDYGDGEQIRTGFAAGSPFAQRTGHISMAYEYHSQKMIVDDSRPFTAKNSSYIALNPDNPNQLSRRDDVRSARRFTVNVPTAQASYIDFNNPRSIFTNDQGQPLGFDEAGTLRPFNPGQVSLNNHLAIGGDGHRSSSERLQHLPYERHNLFGTLKLDTSSNTRFQADLLYAQNTSYNPFYIPAETLGVNALPVLLSNAAPVLSQHDYNILDSKEGFTTTPYNFYLHKSWNDVGNNELQQTTETGQLRFTLDTDFWLNTRYWNINSYLSYGQSEQHITQDDLLCSPIQAVFSSFLECNSNNNENLMVYPFFGRVPESQQSLYTSKRHTKIKRGLSNGSVILRGGLYDLPGGEAEIALGYEYFEHTGEVHAARESHMTSPFRLPPDINNAYQVHESFLELKLPTIGKDTIKGLQAFSIETSYRHSDDSRVGNDHSYSLGFRAELTPSPRSFLLFRGNISRAYKHPEFLETDSPMVSAIVDPSSEFELIDNPPCDFVTGSVETARQEKETRIQHCQQDAARRVSTGELRPDFEYNSGIFLDTGDALSPQPLIASGNPNLESEISNSRSFGLALGVDDGFKLAIDWIDLKIDNLIEMEDPLDPIEACYDQGREEACRQIVVNEDFQLQNIYVMYQNTGTISSEVLNFTLDLPMPMWSSFPGQIKLKSQAQYLIKRTNEEGQNITGGFLNPRINALTSLQYMSQHFDLSLTQSYFGSSNYDFHPNKTIENTKIDAHSLLHLSARYHFNEHLSISGSVQNVLNQQAPSSLESIDARGEYSSIGRYFLLSSKWTF